MSETTPAGWYPDPENDAGQRYWDGTQWTEHKAPGSGATPPPGAGGFSQPGYAQPAYGMQQKVDPWLWQSIVATLLCCLPFGIAGIVFAAQANSANAVGDFATATEKAKQARLFTLIAVGVGVLVGVVYFVFVLAVIGSEGNF